MLLRGQPARKHAPLLSLADGQGVSPCGPLQGPPLQGLAPCPGGT